LAGSKGFVRRPFAWIGLLLWLTACQSTPSVQTPFPSLQFLQLAYSPGSRPALTAFEQCAGAQPGLALLPDEIPVTVMSQTKADLWLRFGTPENWNGYAVQLAEEQIVFLVHPDNPIRALNLKEIQSIFSGQVQSWDQVGGANQSIRVWVLPPADEARQTVDQNLLANQTISDQAYLAAGPEDMIMAVAKSPGAIGYVPQAWIDTSVKVVSLPTNLKDLLPKPLLALSVSEPEGQVRQLLECLQSGSGQDLLRTRYP
jgi:hypothetical protein